MITLRVCRVEAWAGKGRVWRRSDTMPVPIVTENHDGVKFWIKRRQPWSSRINQRGSGGGEWESGVVFSSSASFAPAGEIVMLIESLLACELRERLCTILGGEVDANPRFGNDCFPLTTTNYVVRMRFIIIIIIISESLLFGDDCEEYKSK